MESVIDCYVETILAPHLVELGVAHLPGVLVAVVTDVRLRLQSLLARWQDHTLRQTLLLIGQEEGMFYQPELAPLEICALVVVAIRNSLLEELASSHAAIFPSDLPRHSRPLVQDEGIRAITQEAVLYWQRVDLARLSLPPPSPAQDCFGHLPQAFPHAWHVLSRLAQAKTPIISFPPCQAPLPELPTSSLAAGVSKQVVVQSGLSPQLDSHLIATLRALHDGQLDLLFIDSWNMLTRHPEKLFRILDFVLAHQGSVVTHNYLLTATMACARQGLLRSAHAAREAAFKFQNQIGLSTAHRNALTQARKRFS